MLPLPTTQINQQQTTASVSVRYDETSVALVKQGGESIFFGERTSIIIIIIVIHESGVAAGVCHNGSHSERVRTKYYAGTAC